MPKPVLKPVLSQPGHSKRKQEEPKEARSPMKVQIDRPEASDSSDSEDDELEPPANKLHIVEIDEDVYLAQYSHLTVSALARVIFADDM